MSAREKSDLPEVAEKRANKVASAAAELVERRGGAKENAELQSTVRTQSREAVSQAQARIREAVNRNRQDKLTALLHHLTIDVLRASFFGLKKSAAPGVDEMTWTEYAEGLEENLSDLHSRVQTGAYRALPSRRTYIPKADGRQRPLGIAALEDKIVQAAVVAILTPIYEAEFLGFSYGFRPKRSQHQALDALAFGIGRRRINWVLDCDVQSFFDKVSQSWLIRFIEHRIGDRRIIRLIAKWLTAGVLEGGHLMVTEEGTPQGAVMAPRTQKITFDAGHDSVGTFGRRAVPWSRGQGNAVADDDLVIADEDFLDEKPQDALAFRYVEGIRRRPKSSEERGQRFSEAQVGCAID